jgi:hypothetical protein
LPEPDTTNIFPFFINATCTGLMGINWLKVFH